MSKSAEFTAAAKKISFNRTSLYTIILRKTIHSLKLHFHSLPDTRWPAQLADSILCKLETARLIFLFWLHSIYSTRTSLSSRSLWNFKLSFFSFFKVSLFSNRKVTAISPSHDEKQLCNTSRGVEENFLFFSPFFPFFPPFHSPFARCAPCKTL